MSEDTSKPQYTWWSILLGITIEGGFVVLGSIAIEYLLNADRQELTVGTLSVAIGILVICVLGTVGALFWAQRKTESPGSAR